MDTHKLISASKLLLAIMLLFVIVKTILVPLQTKRILGPSTVQARINSHTDDTIYSSGLSAKKYTQIVSSGLFNASKNLLRNGNFGAENYSFGPQSSVSQELGLVLLGTISGNSKVARAIIQDIGNKSKDQYKFGQVINGARIERIEADSVHLYHEGQIKILPISGWQTSNDNNPSSLPLTYRNINKTIKADFKSKVNHSESSIKVNPIEQVLSKAIIEPYVIDEQIEGLKITGLEKLTKGNNFGLKNGDVICSINGHRLTSKQKAFQAMKKAKSKNTVTIELLRGKNLNKLTFAF